MVRRRGSGELRPPVSLPPPPLKPLNKSRGFFGPTSFHKELPNLRSSSTRYAMDSIELDTDDDDVELVSR